MSASIAEPEIGKQAYSNESITRDRERDEDSRAVNIESKEQPGQVPIEATHQPKINGSTGQGESILQDRPSGTLQKGEAPGIGANGVPVV